MECLLPDISIPKQFLQLFLNAKNTLKERYRLLFFVFICSPLFLYSQPEIAKVQHFGEKEGLDLLINQIFQDKKGMLWLLGWHDNPFFHEVESHLIQFDGREFRTIYDRPNLDAVMFRLSTVDDKQLIINYLGPYFDVFDTQTGHFETVDLNLLSNEVQRVWSSSEAKMPYTFALKTVPEVKLFSWDNKQLDSICTIPRRESNLQLWGFFQHKNYTWVSDGGIGWVKYDHTSKQMRQYTVEDFEGLTTLIDTETPITFVNAIVASNGEILVAVRNALPGYYLYDQKQDKFNAIPGLPNDLESYLPIEDKAGRILFTYWPSSGQRRALWLLDLDGNLIDYSHVSESLNANMYCVYSSDFTDHLWVGTYTGLAFIKLRSKEKSIEQLPTPYSMRSMIELDTGKLLLSTELNGWFLWDKAQDTLLSFPIFQNGQHLPTNYCRGFFRDENGWILASNLFGLVKFNPITKEAIFYEASIKIQAFTKMKNGHFLLVGDHHSVPIEFDPINEVFSDFIPETNKISLMDRFSHTILETKNGIIWVGTNRGLLRYDKKLPEVRVFSKKDGLKSNVILYLYEATDGKLWMGTGGAGVHIFDPETEQFSYLQEKEGLTNNTVAGILKDSDGDMWFSTFKGISCYKPEEETFLNFSQEDGFSHFEFNRYSFYQKSDGRLCFGTLNGMNIFDPQALKGTPKFPKLWLTEAQFYDGQEGKQKIRHYNLSELTTINLPPDNRYLRFKFALSDFENADQHKFAYFLEGYDDNWNTLGNKNEVIFNKLPVGNYTLHLQGLNARGEFNANPVTIDIHIAQYFYKSTWFYFLCLACVGGGVVWWIMRLRSQKQRLEAEVRKRTENIRQDKLIIEEQANQLKELDHFKTRFYTNLTHEFRTPLTVILGMVTKIRTYKNAEKLITKNARSLLRLINQLLDFSKIEAGMMDLKLEKGDLVGFVHFIAESFESYAASCNVRLQSHADIPGFIAHFDRDKIRHIVVNLVSNAIKFSKKGGKVLLLISRNDTDIVIKVQDNGIGIPKEKLPYVFDRFYQADNPDSYRDTRPGEGTGIGLALVKELVNLMDGQIGIQSKLEWGTTVTVTLPLEEVADGKAMAPTKKEEEWLEADLLIADQTVSTKEIFATDKPQLLVIEDNHDLTAYFQTCLEKDYNISFAYDGKQGIEKAFELIPDLIITDVMMPEKDGYEVCQTLKSDIRSSHIPVIILTAKADFDSKMQGLQTGADAFLSKPFEEKELLLRLQKLNELRERLKDKYAGSLPESSEPNLEDRFLQQLRDCIEASIDDPDFEILHLCQAVHLSHSQVYRKIKALTGKTPSTFIRGIRLQKAMGLLKTTQKNISEIAWDVGFVSPDHFSKAFKQEYGTSPSAIRK